MDKVLLFLLLALINALLLGGVRAKDGGGLILQGALYGVVLYAALWR